MISDVEAIVTGLALPVMNPSKALQRMMSTAAFKVVAPKLIQMSGLLVQACHIPSKPLGR